MLKTYKLIEEFNRLFLELQGSLKCRELLGVDMKTKEGAERILEELI